MAKQKEKCEFCCLWSGFTSTGDLRGSCLHSLWLQRSSVWVYGLQSLIAFLLLKIVSLKIFCDLPTLVKQILNLLCFLLLYIIFYFFLNLVMTILFKILQEHGMNQSVYLQVNIRTVKSSASTLCEKHRMTNALSSSLTTPRSIGEQLFSVLRLQVLFL